jgi:hypothetical protein
MKEKVALVYNFVVASFKCTLFFVLPIVSTVALVLCILQYDTFLNGCFGLDTLIIYMKMKPITDIKVINPSETCPVGYQELDSYRNDNALFQSFLWRGLDEFF